MAEGFQHNKDIFKDMEISDDEGEMQAIQLNLKEIILRHIKKISDICCKEFTGGYWEKKPIKTGTGILFTEQYHDDVREAYCNAVDFLIDVLYPLADDDFRKYIKTNEDVDKDSTLEIKEKLKLKRKIFKEINIMFDRVGLFGSVGISNE
jgi:hypothetical protein